MPAYFRLQDLTSIDSSGPQRIEEAIDLGAYGTLAMQCRVAQAAGASSVLKLEHAATREEAAFTEVTSDNFVLDSTGNQYKSFTNLLRYVRWTATITSGTAQFLLDVVAREA